ncbi:uncharacterized protein A4U43_C07F9670 [Asparagus officinalis]|uniref:Beta-glucosidase n=1 Tax=Asparagus officinalis TaxID=4686 RepID=A0A5P1ECJ8_ASPOF|nr:beta-glucosidase 11-like [Asparagus officinalis]XP_020274275.1 beta-glucosidase 11-like [Asparagus officinalis]ONK62937.1 uncharacterized protein A4U43_C07F9670 [Asparagus officinalis]
MRLFLLLFLSIPAASSAESSSTSVSRVDFPKGFVFGSGTSAYQVEGAASEDGRTPSIWDTFAHNGNVGGTGDVASDGYHKYKEDVKLMKETGLEGYRFSISWSRLIPRGRGEVNSKGLEYYNNFINELISHGIEPHVTLLHFDLPQVLEDEYGGWLNPRIVDDFTAYADVCFREFGDRVSHWTTINEANIFALGGYGQGILPPKRCSPPFGNCSSGNSIVEPYVVAHHFLLAHSSAASLYKKNYQAKQQGSVGLNLLVFHMLPATNSTADISSTKRAQIFFTGWFMEPLVHGDYPKIMRKAAGKKMPKFSSKQSKQLMNSFDFVGVNYYATVNVVDGPNHVPAYQRDFMGDICANITGLWMSGGRESMEAGMNAPYGLKGVLEYFKQNYGNPPIYVQENGYPMPSNASLDDTPRVKHMSAHLESLLDAVRNGSNTTGFFTWSFVDAFELFGGYSSSYGLYRVDFGDKERKRYPKHSARWYSHFLKRRGNSIYTDKSSSYVPQIY